MTLNTISPTIIETSVLIGDVTNTPAQGSLPSMTTDDDGNVVSAALEIQSTTGALLIPRMSGTQQDALTAVAGMIIYNTEDETYNFFDGTDWNSAGGDVSSTGTFNEGNVAVFADDTGKLIADGGASFSEVAIANRSSISDDMVTELAGIAHIHFNDSTNYGFLLVNDNLGIGLYQSTLEDDSSQINILFTGSSQEETISSVSALVELQSTTGALLVSRMTSTQRDALESPQDGMIIYNTTIPAFNMRENSSWVTIGTVTSVAATTSSTGLSISGSPITTAGTLTFALNNELQGLAGLSSTGIITRTGSGTYTPRFIAVGSSNLTVTNGSGVSGNPTLDLGTTTVTAGSYTYSSITVDAYGRLTAASNGTSPVTSVSGTSGQISSTGGTTPVLSLVSTAVTPGSYTYGGFTVDAYGRLTAASSGTTPVTSVAATTSSTGLSISGSPITTTGTLTFTLNSELQGLAGLASVGMVTRTGSGTYSLRSIAVGSSNLTVSNGNGVSGNPTLDLGTTAVTAGSYTYPSITVDAYGRLTAASSGTAPVTSISGTTNQITVTGTTTPTLSISSNPVIPGTASLTLPIGSTANRPGSPVNGMIRYNSDNALLEGYVAGSWATIDTAGGTVTSVAATGSTGLTVGGSPITTSGTLTFTLGTELQGLAGLSTTGLVQRTGSGTYTTLSTPLSVSNGGSGNSSATAYAVLCGGTTSTGAYQSIASVGTSGQLLTSNGAAALPTFQTYAGTSSITTVGTVTSGTWNGSVITGTYGGTGVNNASKTITLGGNLTTSGAYNLTLTLTGTSSITLPTSGTLVAGPGSSTSGNISTFNNTSGTLLADSGLNLLVSSGSAYIFMDTSKNTVNTGSSITSYGVNCLRNNTTGSYNSGFGNICLQNNGSGYNNSGFGYQCLTSSSSGHDNSGFGFNSLYGCTTGTQNSGFGSGAAQNVSTGAENSAFGNNALKNTTTPSFNTAIGSGCLTTNTTGASNTGCGQASLNNNSTGSNSSAFGIASLYNSTTASNNCSFGYFSMYNNSTGASNCAFGYNAGRSYTTNSSCTFIGYSADSSVNNLTNSCAIGANTAVGVSNAIVLGNGCYVGIGKNSPAYALQLGTDNSSTPLFYMASASVPSAPGTANDGIYSVATGKPTFTSGTAKYSGTIATATSGSAATAGQATLNGTTGVTVTTSAIATTSIVLVTHSTGTGAPTLANLGTLTVGSISAGTSFVIYSSNMLDTVTVNWFLINP